MKNFIVIILCIGMFLIPAFAGAVVLTFDDLPPVELNTAIPNGYGGLDWNNMDYDKSTIPPPPGGGFYLGRVSGDYVALNHAAGRAIVSGSIFDFNGAYLTGGLNDGVNIRVQGYSGAALLYDDTVVVNATSPTWFQFDFLGIDQLAMSSSGGTAHWSRFPNSVFVMDNFKYNATPVPDPSTLLLLGSGLVGLVGIGRKRFKK